MIKLIGAILIIASCGWMGFNLSAAVSRRVVFLEQVILMLNGLLSEIKYMSFSTARLVGEYAKKNDALKFMSTCNHMLCKGVDFPSAFENAVINDGQIESTDKELLLSFGRELGRSDTTGQIQLFELYLQRFEEQKRQASELKKKKCGLYQKLGLLTGFAIAMLLI